MSDELSPEILSVIEDEEAALAAVKESLYLQLSRGKDRLAIESSRARQLNTEIVLARRAEDKSALASDEAVSYGLSNLKRTEVSGLEDLLDRPYFARIVVEEENKNGKLQTIEYKLGLQSNIDCRIIDWRKAPISKLYYEYQEGDHYLEEIQGKERQGKVLLRNKVEINNGALVRISCRFGDFIHRGGKWQKAGTERRSRGKSGYRQLPDVLSLITAEQFRMITEEATTAVIIQGVAGSGKTTVALHRLSWLLHEDNSQLAPNDCLVLTKSRPLMSYIKESLNVLKVTGVNVSTYLDWAKQSLLRIEQEEKSGAALDSPDTPLESKPLTLHPGISRVKRSMAMLKAIEAYAEDQGERLIEYLAKEIHWEKLSTDARRLFAKIRDNEPFRPRQLSIVIIDELSSLFVQERQRANQHEYLGQAILILEQLRKKLTLYREDVIKTLERHELILGFDETKLLDRELIKNALEYTKSSKQEGVLDDDDEALMFRLFELKNGYIVKQHRTAGKSDTGRYRLIIVDEVQDFSPVELSTVIGAVDNINHLTLVGDSAQEISHETTFPGWDKLRKHWNLGESLSQFVTLSVSHRSTLPIMRLADHVLRSNRTTGGRNGLAPVWYRCRSEDNAAREAIGWLSRVSERYPGGLILALCRNQTEANYLASLLEPTFGNALRLGSEDNFTFEEGILVTDVAQVKGLEFENVLLWNPSAEAYPVSEQSQKLLYVAITRAEEHLCLVTCGRESTYLPTASSKLVRVIEEDEPEEQEEDLSSPDTAIS